MSIASSSGATNAMLSTKSSFRGSRNGSTRSVRSTRSKSSLPPVPPPSRPNRKKRSSTNSLSSDSDVIRSVSSNNKHLHPDFDTSSDEKNKDIRDKKKPPPLPSNPPNLSEFNISIYHLNSILHYNNFYFNNSTKIKTRRRSFITKV
jgi:hypothetical protein